MSIFIFFNGRKKKLNPNDLIGYNELTGYIDYIAYAMYCVSFFWQILQKTKKITIIIYIFSQVGKF